MEAVKTLSLLFGADAKLNTYFFLGVRTQCFQAVKFGIVVSAALAEPMAPLTFIILFFFHLILLFCLAKARMHRTRMRK